MKIEVVKKIQGMERLQFWLKIIGWLCVILAVVGMFVIGFKSYVVGLYLAGIVFLIVQLWLRVKEYKYVRQVNADEKNLDEVKTEKKKVKRKK